jgi:hypothetical protein
MLDEPRRPSTALSRPRSTFCEIKFATDSPASRTRPPVAVGPGGPLRRRCGHSAERRLIPVAIRSSSGAPDVAKPGSWVNGPLDRGSSQTTCSLRMTHFDRLCAAHFAHGSYDEPVVAGTYMDPLDWSSTARLSSASQSALIDCAWPVSLERHVISPTPAVQTLRWLVQQFLRDVASIFCDLVQHGLVQPHVHLGRVAHQLGGTPELGR